MIIKWLFGLMHRTRCFLWERKPITELLSSRYADDDVAAPPAHLPGGLHALPDAEVTDEPNGGEAQSQLPADRTQLV